MHRGRLGRRGRVVRQEAEWARVGRKSYVFAGGKKFEWKWATGQWVFLVLLDGLGVTPV